MLLDTWRILECINVIEYNALTEVKKEYTRMILSVGQVNFDEGSLIWNAMMVTIFPSGTTTHQKILECLARVYDTPGP